MSDPQSRKKQIIQDLQSVFPFAQELTYQQLEMLADHALTQEVCCDSIIAESIGSCPGIALIVSGELRVSRMSDDGREITVYRIGKGKTCPLSTVCLLGSVQGYPAKVFAGTDTKIIWISKDFINKSMKECEPFWRFVFSCLARSLFAAMEVVDSIAFIPVRKRLAQTLLVQSNSGRHPVYTTHDALAKELGTAREVISRELKSLERCGVIEIARGRITIKNVEALQNNNL